MSEKLPNMLDSTIAKIREMVDVNSVIGNPITTPDGVTFANQITKVDAYRPEKRFADAVKGLHIYGAEVVYPEEMVLINVSI